MKDLPLQFLAPSKPLEARFLIGSFGTSAAYNGVAFPLTVARDPNEPVPTVEVSRYGKLPEIHHIFKADPQSPPVVITLAFVAMALACLPVLAGVVSQCSVRYAWFAGLTVIFFFLSGCSSVSTSNSCPRPSSRPLCPTLFSWALCSPSRASSSYTTPTGISSRCSLRSRRPEPWRSSVVVAHSAKCRVGVSPDYDKG